jgi:hypothetical protein
MASSLMVWAAIGKPNQREWTPSGFHGYAKNDGLYPSGYHLFQASAKGPSGLSGQAASPANGKHNAAERDKVEYSTDRLWKGWVLPASDADVWFAAGSAAYYHDLQSEDLDRKINSWRATYRRLQIAATPRDRYALEEAKGVLYLDALRKRLGDDAFLKLMRDYYAANTTKTVTAQSFLDRAGAPFAVEAGAGPAYLTTDIRARLSSAILVYGTVREAGANRYAAEQLQKHFLDMYESAVPIRKDFEVTGDDLRARDVVFVGRPEANSALADWSDRLGLDYTDNVFRIDGAAHASERDALLFAAKNPLDPAHMVLVVAGNDALRTVKLTTNMREWKSGEYELMDNGKASAGFIASR